MSFVDGIHGFPTDRFTWDVSGSLGPDTPTSFKLGSHRRREVALHADVSYAATDMINIVAGAE